MQCQVLVIHPKSWCLQAEVNPHAVEEATRPLQQQLRDAQSRQREVARDTARAQAALQAALSRREALEIRVRSKQRLEKRTVNSTI
jgi:hypothetical protein